MGRRIVGGQPVSGNSNSSGSSNNNSQYVPPEAVNPEVLDRFHSVDANSITIRRADPSVENIERFDSSRRDSPVVITRQTGGGSSLKSGLEPQTLSSQEVMSRKPLGPQWGQSSEPQMSVAQPNTPRTSIVGPYDVLKGSALPTTKIVGAYDVINPDSGSVVNDRPRSMMSAASPGLALATKEARVKDVGRSFARGFFFEPPGDPIQDAQAGATAYYAGLGLGIAGFGKGVKGGQAIWSWSDDAARAAAKAVTGSKTGQKVLYIGGKLVKDTSIALGIAKGSKEAARLTASPEQREIMSQVYFPEVVREAHVAAGTPKQEDSFDVPFIGGQTSWRSIGAQVTPFLEDKKAFEAKARQEFSNRGLRGEELDTAVDAAMRQKRFTNVGETASLLWMSYQAERTGQWGVQQVFGKFGGTAPAKKAFGETFKRTFLPIGFAGFQEGATQQLAADISREQKLNPKQALIEGGIGAASAGLLGPTIAGLKAKGSRTGTIVNVAANVMDPYEYPGDLLASGRRGVERSVFGVSTTIPTITKSTTPATPTSSQQEMISFGVSTQKPKRDGGLFGLGGSPSQTPSQAQQSIQETLIGSKTRSSTPAPGSLKNPIPIYTPLDTPTESPTESPAESPAETPSQTQTPSDTVSSLIYGTQTPAETPTQTQTPAITTTISIPTITPMMRMPPPVPLALPAMGGASYSKPKNKKYVRELELAQKQFGELMYGPAFGTQSSTRSVKKRKASKSRRPTVSELIGL